jgi:hypothetical protein
LNILYIFFNNYSAFFNNYSASYPPISLRSDFSPLYKPLSLASFPSWRPLPGFPAFRFFPALQASQSLSKIKELFSLRCCLSFGVTSPAAKGRLMDLKIFIKSRIFFPYVLFFFSFLNLFFLKAFFVIKIN